jgi:hypothetical protein
MRNFGQDGQKSLAEVTDSDGRLWRILTMASGDVTTFFVYHSAGQIDIAAAAYRDRAGASHAFVSVDSAEKEAALGVLDRKFLSGLTGRSERFDGWVKTSVFLTHGGADETTRVETKPGGMGSGSVHVQGGGIVVDERKNPQPISCSCQDTGGAGCGDTARHKCINALCDLINCVNRVIYTGAGSCGGEANTAINTCSLLAN